MQFSGKIGQVIGWHPPLGVSTPSSGKSWIRHWDAQQVIQGGQWMFMKKYENHCCFLKVTPFPALVAFLLLGNEIAFFLGQAFFQKKKKKLQNSKISWFSKGPWNTPGKNANKKLIDVNENYFWIATQVFFTLSIRILLLYIASMKNKEGESRNKWQLTTSAGSWDLSNIPRIQP